MLRETKIFLAVVGAGALTAFLIWIYSLGHAAGEQKIQDQWDVQKASYEKAIQNAQADLTRQQVQHAKASAGIEHDLAQLVRAHDGRLDALRREHADRLRLSEARADRYRAAAEGGSTQCLNLAGYAAELDRALEEGISLAGELEATIGRRDAEVKLLAKQILTDRELLDER